MIRYPVASATIEAAVRKVAPGWLESAAIATHELTRQGRFDAIGPAWSDVKPVFMNVQHNKCAYCERKQGRAIELDIEHFRPKAMVEQWPTPALIAKRPWLDFGFSTGAAAKPGYYNLAYDLRNYAVSCKICNTNCKGNAFPVAGQRAVGITEPAILASEEPLLLFPFSDGSPDPEEVIEFRGIVPIPRDKAGPHVNLAIVTINLFELETRGDLREERAEVISSLCLALDVSHSFDPRLRQEAQEEVARLTHSGARQTNCARSFERLYRSDPMMARRFAREARDLVDDLRQRRTAFAATGDSDA